MTIEREQLPDGATPFVIERAQFESRHAPSGRVSLIFRVELRRLDFPNASYRVIEVLDTGRGLPQPVMNGFTQNRVDQFIDGYAMAADFEAAEISELSWTDAMLVTIRGAVGIVNARRNMTARGVSSMPISWQFERCSGEWVRPLNRIRYLLDHPARCLHLEQFPMAARLAEERALAEDDDVKAAAWMRVASRLEQMTGSEWRAEREAMRAEFLTDSAERKPLQSVQDRALASLRRGLG